MNEACSGLGNHVSVPYLKDFLAVLLYDQTFINNINSSSSDYNSFSLDTFLDPQWMPEMMDNTKPYIHLAFSYPYMCLIKFHL